MSLFRLKNLNTESGFTLTELIIVIVVIGILAAIGVPAYIRHINHSKAAEAPTIITALVEYAEGYARAHPEIASSTTYTDWGMLGSDAETDVVDGDWVEEVVGADNIYFNYYYDVECDTVNGTYKASGPCLFAAGKGGEFNTDDELVYFLDPLGNGSIGGAWWSGNERLVDVMPD